MLYKSTRASTPLRTFQEILFLGLSPEGGLFIPETIPRLTVPSPPPSRIPDWSFRIVRLYIAQHEIPDPDLKQIINKAFATFETEDWMKRLGDGLWLLELWHGPTFAFKDVALQVVGALFEYFLKKNKSTVKYLSDLAK
jgi:threonine synthase